MPHCYSTPHVHVTTLGDDDTYDVANIIDVVKIDMVHGRRGNYLRFYTIFWMSKVHMFGIS
jgi:hypothetical protein